MNTPLLSSIVAAALCLSLFSGSGSAQNSGFRSALSLDDFIRIGLEHSPELQAARSAMEESKARLRQKRSGYLPQFNVSANGSLIHLESDPEAIDDSSLHGGLSGSQLITDLGQTTGLIQAARHDLNASEFSYQQNVVDTVYQIKSAYFQVMEKFSLIEVAHERISNYQIHLNRAREYYEAGVRTKIDVTNGQVELSNAKLNLLQAQFSLKRARTRLERVIGTSPNQGNYRIEGEQTSLEDFTRIIPEPAPELEQTLSAAHEKRPDLSGSKQLVAVADSLLSAKQGRRWPKLSAGGSYDGYNDSDIPGLTDQWRIGLDLSWSAFTGGRTSAEIQEGVAGLEKARSGLRSLELAVTEDVTNSLFLVEEYRSSVLLAQETLRLAKENLELADQRYKEGLGDMIEFNDAQTRLTEAQSQLVTTFYGYRTAVASLDRAMGQSFDSTVD